jgi:hypothetical protein
VEVVTLAHQVLEDFVVKKTSALHLTVTVAPHLMNAWQRVELALLLMPVLPVAHQVLEDFVVKKTSALLLVRVRVL